MKKKSYSSGDEIKIEPQEEVPVDLIGREKESSTENGGRFGINLLEMTREPLLFGGKDPWDYDEGVEKDKSKQKPFDDKILKLLVFLGDEMDKKDEIRLANFADFLIKKFANASKVDFTEKFNQLMIKINNSDITNRNETIKKLTKIYSKTLSLEFMNNNNLESAKESAYKKTLHRADQYLGEG